MHRTITMERACSFFLAALVVNFATTMSSSFAINNSNDLDGLLALKAAIFHPQNILPLNWSTSTSVCKWIGITCNSRHQRVAAIDLPNMGLTGTIPPQLGNLSFLILLNFENNSFHGSLPMELSHLRRLKYISLGWNYFEGGFPSWVGALTELQFLSLHDNIFSGPLPGEIANATKLEIIGLEYNHLTGNLPEEFSYLQNLKVLDMGFNQLRGTFPRALLNISSLQKFSFASNNLSGNLPASICHHLPQLELLHLSSNEFDGKIPSGIGDCSRLQTVSLSQNKLSGSIPREMWNITTLSWIQLGDNDLEGVISHEIGNLYRLSIIDLDSNRLTGSIPATLFNISTVRSISLIANEFSGNVPPNLGVMTSNLEELYLGGNKLSGLILTCIANASRLRALDLTKNKFTGAIPHSLGNLRFLQHLSLAKNRFSHDPLDQELSFLASLSNCKQLRTLWIAQNPLNGFLPYSIGNLSLSLKSFDASTCGTKGEIPSSIGNLSNLVSFNLAVNGLKGAIPNTVKGLSKLQRINLEGNSIKGPIPSEFCDLLNLGELILDNNRLSGMVPNCLGNITSLRYLYLYANSLTSTLPTSLGSLKDILELDLSYNTLTGSLPSEIGNLKAIISMKLSMNQFYGEIPSTIGSLENLQELHLENNKLQGLIPESMKNMLGLQYLDLSFNNLAGEIPNSLEALLHLKYFNVSYNKLRGPIPQGGSFKNFTNLSFISNEGLCGAPWLNPCHNFKHQLTKTKKIVLFVLLPVGISVLLALVISFHLMRKLRRKTIAPSDADHKLFPATTYERVSFHELRQITDAFSESNLLGSGTFGSVYRGVRENGIIWAIKVFNLELQGAFTSFDRECEVLRGLRHRNLTKVITACSNPDFKALVLEYMPNGSLDKWLHEDHGYLSFLQRLDIMLDVGRGLEYLHHGYSVTLVHCDLKPTNILLDQDMVAHVSDFGLTKLLEVEESVVQTKTLATFGYIAPEYGLEGLVSTRCDIYSFGITLMETFTGRRPKDEIFTEELSIRCWIQESLPDSINQVIDVNLLKFEDEPSTKMETCVLSILQLALTCTTDAPEERNNIKDVLVALEKIKFQFLQTNKKS